MSVDSQPPPHRSDGNEPRTAPPPPPVLAQPSDYTVPLAPRAPLEQEPTLFGLPAELVTGAGGERLIDTSAVRMSDDGGAIDGPAGTAGPIPRARRWPRRGPDSPVQLVTIRRADPVAGVTLVLAGVSAAVSLLLPWYRGIDSTGLPAVRQGLVVLRSGAGALGSSGLWWPVAVVLGGGVLLLVGLLMFRRARSHRLLGVLALLVAMGAGAGVVVPLANAGWSTASFAPGMWCAVAVAALGTLGAVKAMLTGPLIRLGPTG
jgi:hypothetical protein